MYFYIVLFLLQSQSMRNKTLWTETKLELFDMNVRCRTWQNPDTTQGTAVTIPTSIVPWE